MRSLAFASLVVWFTSCAGEPPLREAVPVPVEVASLRQDQLGVWPLDRKPTATWQALQGAPAEWQGTKDGAFAVTFDEQAPIEDVRWWFGSVFPSNYEQRQPTHVIVRFRQSAKGDDEALAQLRAIGLGPTGMLGIDDGVWLTSATADPRWVLRWIDGRVYSAVRSIGDVPMREVQNYRTVADLRELPRTGDDGRYLTRCLYQARQQTCAEGEPWRRAVAELEQEVYGGMLRPYRDQIAAIDQRMAAASTLSAKARVFRDIRPIVVATRTGAGTALPPIAEWHSRHFDAFFAQMDAMFEGEARTSWAVRSAYRIAREGLTRRYWVTPNPKRSWQWDFYQSYIDYNERWVQVRDDDPYREFARRLEWCAASKRPKACSVETHPQAARDRFVALRTAAESSAFEQQWLAGLGKWQPRQQRQVLGCAEQVRTMRSMLSYLDGEPLDALAELEALSSCYACRRDLRAAFVERARPRLRACARRASGVDGAVIRAVMASMQDGGAFETTVAKAPALLRAARAVPAGGTLEQRLEAYAALAARTSELGPSCEFVAGELSVPAGRELAQQAAQLADKGEHGRAALLYLNAATLGSRTAPAPTSVWAARRHYQSLLAAEKQGKLDGRDERRDWLARARMFAYVVAQVSLPVTARDDPIYDLQDRYVGSQLAGRARLSTAFGVRLGGLYDVRRDRKPEEEARLLEKDGQIAWRRAAEGGEAVDLSRYQIDKDGWRRYRVLRGELNEAEANLRAARKSSGTPRATLVEQQQQLNGQITAVNEQIRAGTVNPSAANGEVARLQRESTALSIAIQNFNRRNAHIQEMTRLFNEKVPPHNELLERLLAEQSRAYEQLLRPSNDEYALRQIAGSGLPAAEQQARRWILGLGDATPISGAIPVPHPQALASRVRDVSDPAIAAAHILDSLRRRRDDRRLWPGVTLEQHLEALRDALRAYGRQYGTEDLFVRVMSSDLIPSARYAQIQRFFTDAKRRAALQKLMDGK